MNRFIPQLQSAHSTKKHLGHSQKCLPYVSFSEEVRKCIKVLQPGFEHELILCGQCWYSWSPYPQCRQCSNSFFNFALSLKFLQSAVIFSSSCFLIFIASSSICGSSGQLGSWHCKYLSFSGCDSITILIREQPSCGHFEYIQGHCIRLWLSMKHNGQTSFASTHNICFTLPLENILMMIEKSVGGVE